ncbi:C-Jun-amino-terminal kinase-interacting protein 4 isoform X1 [Lingula anatina]|uniref:C-Jun-amino-terminal kinase-interacting protein 4 isoform X1 n=1 Tax=Lingula anatina TaxID=7574 RepID=A0A1S3HFK4_LINAN|nr:C-Jun-amino-terminal kinase-interacting protein 4 isoform X1 [Lingula anatina]|eukprot:XP_013384858.1 C-Jun-amino-terminal kinase-interacting protein 4 isoform X1 [Lingula anatina]
MAETSGDTVYGTQESETHVMSERVQALAASVYGEFERMIKKYDEDVVKQLMPIVVGVLENLDQSYRDKQENEVELELLRDDNEQLLTQYEREKQLRKQADQKYLEIEDVNETERKALQDKVESLESIVKMFELKAKNNQDHLSRLEEKEAESKKEYNKLHERYTELFRTHMDYMERTKILMASQERVSTEPLVSPKGRSGLHLPHLKTVPGGVNIYSNAETPSKGELTPDYSGSDSSSSRPQSHNTSLSNEMKQLERERAASGDKKKTADKTQVTDSLETAEHATTPAAKENDSNTKMEQTGEKQISTGTVNTNQTGTESPDKTGKVHASPVSSLLTSSTPVARVPLVPVKQEFLNSIEESYEVPRKRVGQTMAEIIQSTPELEDFDGMSLSKSNKPRGGNESSLYDELYEDIAEMDDGIDITGKPVHPGEYASSDSENDDESHVSDTFFGMGKEVENLISENNELLATKNALNIVKDDLIAQVDELTSEQEMLRQEIQSLQTIKVRLSQRISELEEELKKTKEELEKKSSAAQADDEEDVPMSQRKRFTRVEMARVLMERNQYKERLMELQEAVRWTEMIRASREHPEVIQTQKKKSSVWGFFGNLFSSSSNKPKKEKLPMATVRYNAPTTHVQPVGDPNKKRRSTYNLGDKEQAYDFMEDQESKEKSRLERERERKEQYKQVRAHVKKDDGRMQAYGWSLPAKFQPSVPKEGGRSAAPVPVPVYCRPLMDNEPGMKLWCAAGVNITGGRTRDGGSIVGASVFYSNPPPEEEKTKTVLNEVDKLDQELQEHEKGVNPVDQNMSSLVWICTSTHSSSVVSVIDANNPGDILETFPSTHSPLLCISSVPGARESDYPVDDELLQVDQEAALAPPSDNESVKSGVSSNGQVESSGIGGISFVQCVTGSTISPVGSYNGSAFQDSDTIKQAAERLRESETDEEKDANRLDDSSSKDPLGASASPVKATVLKATGSPASSGGETPTSSIGSGSEKRFIREPNELVKDGISVPQADNNMVASEVEKMSSVLPTMWLGSQSGSLFVHSAVSQWKRCLHSVKLKDSILSIVHVKGRVLVALADGTVAIFHRDSDGQWDLRNYHLLDLGRPHHSIRCMAVIGNKHVWCGYKNRIHVVDPKSLKIHKSFDAHPRKESQVRQLAWVGDGVWVSIRLDSTLRLYHAYTHEHLQDVDIEPYVSKMLGTGKLGFSFVRITSLLVSCKRLWIGTGNGVVISVPLSEGSKQMTSGGGSGRPGGVIRVYSDTKTDSVTPGSFIPFCSMAQAQLSFHGHRDAVKFFVAVPGAGRQGVTSGGSSQTKSKAMLILSGGEGYIDFRIGDGDDESALLPGPAAEEKKQNTLSKGDKSHVIVWEVANQE